MQYPHTLKNNIYHSNKRRPPPIFSFGYQSCTRPRSDLFCWQSPCSGCNRRIDLVVVLEYALFQLCSNAKQITVRLTGFRRSYVNRHAVVLTNHTSYTASFALCALRCSNLSRSFCFLQLLVPSDSAFAQPAFAEHTCCSNVVNSKVGKQAKRREIVIRKYIKTNSWS